MGCTGNSAVDEILIALALSTWAALLSASAKIAESRISSADPKSLSVQLSACAPIVAIGSFEARDPYAIAAALACIALVVGAFADARTGYLFDGITFPAAIVTATIAVATGYASQAIAGVALLVGVFGAVAAFSRGRAIGLGDVKAMYAIGAAFGPAKAIFIVFVASLSGLAAAALSHRIARVTHPIRREIPFGPHLAIGSSLALIAGDHVVHGALGL
jgi:prepilin signal peptidase PulO-like enzyme (type II secretory pathway)